MSKKTETKTTTDSKTSTAPVATTPVSKSSRFVRTLESQVASFVAAQKLSKTPEDLSLFLSWSKSNPPAEKITAPSGESTTGKVWTYCDSLSKAGQPFTRKQVVDALVAQGLNRATVSTQYQRWSKAKGSVAA
jgi:hypothetical protein